MVLIEILSEHFSCNFWEIQKQNERNGLFAY
jgi:hypothetical protein